MFFYIFMIGKFELSNMFYLNRVFKIIDFVTRHPQSFLLIYSYCVQSYNNGQMTFCMYDVL
jgi:hypothetical protein